MQPQHLAPCFSCERNNEALPSQTRRLVLAGYVFALNCSKVAPRHTQVSLTSETGRARQFNDARPLIIHRRHRCQRASNFWQPLVSSPWFPHAHPARPKKNTLWFSQSPSRLSPYTPASTSKLAWGRAFAPVPHLGSRQVPASVAPFHPTSPASRPFNRRAV